MKTRVESNHQPESPTTDANGIESRLSGNHIDRLLTVEVSEVGTSDDREGAPMNGVWLAAAVGVILWALIAGVVLLLT